jgi:hypothetical protein
MKEENPEASIMFVSVDFTILNDPLSPVQNYREVAIIRKTSPI